MYTPGEWVVEPLDPCEPVGFAFAVRVANQPKLSPWPVARVIMEPDARLIASAPALLAACESVLEWAQVPGDHGGNPYCKQFVKLAEAAIAQAKGE